MNLTELIATTFPQDVLKRPTNTCVAPRRWERYAQTLSEIGERLQQADARGELNSQLMEYGISRSSAAKFETAYAKIKE